MCAVSRQSSSSASQGEEGGETERKQSYEDLGGSMTPDGLADAALKVRIVEESAA